MRDVVVVSDDKCPEYGEGHIYQFKDGMHRCACGAVAVFDEFSREWS